MKEFYTHENPPSVFVIFDKDYKLVWCYSGNELARIYKESPEEFISEPLELHIPDQLDKVLTELYDNY